MRLYFTEYASSARFGVRPLQIAAVVGAIVIGTVLWFMCGAPVANIALWCAGIAAGEAGIVAINALFLRRRPTDAVLPKWAMGKAALATLGAFAWSFGQMLLHVEGEALTTIVPPWTIIMYCCGAVWAGAFSGTLAASAPQSLWQMRASKSVPRIPTVAVRVCSRAACGAFLEISPVIARRPPANSDSSMLLSGASSLNR